MRPLLKLVARYGGREVFTAAALLLVIGAALIMEEIGLSMSLGAFLAGVLLADSEFRHELEADIEPFKGLLLGLVLHRRRHERQSRAILWRIRSPVLGLALGLMAAKFALMYAIARATGAQRRRRSGWPCRWRRAANSRSCCSPRRRPRACSPATPRSCW